MGIGYREVERVFLQFTLTMPSNGKWGEGRLYARTKYFYNDKKGKELVKKILDGAPYHYSWPDGWRAQIDVKKITSREDKKVREKSKGFAGYDWMIASIVERQEISPARRDKHVD